MVKTSDFESENSGSSPGEAAKLIAKCVCGGEARIRKARDRFVGYCRDRCCVFSALLEPDNQLGDTEEEAAEKWGAFVSTINLNDQRFSYATHSASWIIENIKEFIPEACQQSAYDALASALHEDGLELMDRATREKYEVGAGEA